MPSTALRPRTGPEIIDAAAHLLRSHYAQFVTVSAVIFLPIVASRLFLPEPYLALGDVLKLGLWPLAQGAGVLATSEVYLGREVHPTSCVLRALSRIGSLMGVLFVQGFLIAGGFILLIVPGFLAIASTFAMPMVVVLEERGVLDALGRSRDLAQGSRSRILGVQALSALIVFAAQLVMTWPLMLLVGRDSARTAAIITDAVLILLFPLPYIVATLLYYDLRIRREGFDLEVMAAELDRPKPAGPSASAVG
ncbi:MAG TPA: hypothetical protein VEI06_07785 [Gemmatimonadaceae bacterium]|nr:hypothetical protein [Gemmatimonadaceae bacterium]